MDWASISRLFDFANKYCPRCLRHLPPMQKTFVFRRGLWLYWSMQRRCECGFEHGYPQRLTVRELMMWMHRRVAAAEGGTKP